jgi:phosphatidylglycerol---prolipoprotein diacylglyceryl transferase
VRRTLFYIPHEIAGVPVFGWGWALALWLIFGGAVLLWSVWRHGWNRETRGQLPLLLLVAAAIVLLIPRVEEPIRDISLTIPPVSAVSGLPVRGYGVMLLLAVVSGVSLAAVRAARAGLGADVIMSLAFVLVVGGIVGARLFFVIQYWHLLKGDTWAQTLGNLFSVDKGGLVVYGSLIGAALAFALFCRRYRLPALPLGDLIAPSLALGLALGRVGCLLNGCCFGGPTDHAWAVRFPVGSPPYLDQQGWGEFHGLRLAAGPQGQAVVGAIDPHGPFAATPLEVGDQVVAIDGRSVDRLAAARYALEQAGPELTLTLASGRTIVAAARDLPTHSHPVHPTQLYSSINAMLLCMLCLAIYPFRRRHGQVIALLLSLYALTRFLLEVIRSDEGGLWGDLTISQHISLLIAVGMLAMWVYIQRQPAMRNLPTPGGPAAAGVTSR